MGLSAINSKGWKTNPKKQGISNFTVSIIATAIGNVVYYLINSTILPWWVDLSCIGWGVISILCGFLLKHINKNHHSLSSKQYMK